jgi:hypothetical protein
MHARNTFIKGGIVWLIQLRPINRRAGFCHNPSLIAAAQPLGRLGQQVLGKCPGTLIGAELRLQHMLMADAFRIAGGGGLDIDAVLTGARNCRR